MRTSDPQLRQLLRSLVLLLVLGARLAPHRQRAAASHPQALEQPVQLGALAAPPEERRQLPRGGMTVSRHEEDES